MSVARDPVDQWLKETVGSEANKFVTELEKLTDQQYQFCLEFVKTGSAPKAAKAVGMSRGTNPSLLVHVPKVAACINILKARREAELGEKSSAEIIERLQNTAVIGEEDFDFSSESASEREVLMGRDPTARKGSTDDELAEKVEDARAADNGIMQLPRTRVNPATHFGEQWVLERLVTIAERCLQIEPVFDRKGRPIGQFKFEPQAALRAIEMLGKTLAMFRDKVEIETDVGKLSDDKLDARLRTLIGQNPQFGKYLDGYLNAKEVEAEEVA